MRKLALLFILSGALLLQGCGYHLRGKIELPPSMASVFVEGADLEMVSELKRALEFNGVNIVSDISAAKSSVLIDSRYKRKVRTLDSRGVATGYVLKYDVRFNVVNADGNKVHESPIISKKRNFDFDATQVLQQAREEEFLKEDMRTQIIQSIMRQLSTVTAFLASDSASKLS